MKTTYSTRKKLFAIVAALAASAATGVFAGAGIGQAAPIPPFQSNGTISVQYTTNVFGLNASISDANNLPGVTERCHYHSVGSGQTPPAPFDSDAFPNGTDWATLFIPGMQLGGTWNVTVTCDHGGSYNFDETY